MLNKIRATNAFIANMAAGSAALVMVVITLHILLEITLRALFSTSTHVLDEFAAYGIAAMTFLALAQALSSGSIIRVSLLFSKAPKQVQRLLELFAILTTLTVSCGIAWLVLRSITRNIKRGAVSETVAQVPLWIPEAVVLLGLSVFILTLLVRLLDVLFDFDRLQLGGGH
ncbi:TRAP transporter small permease subunit [Ruegeria arenilitoris]|uniref:TRAP transporter small permease subunit n=1 Tax=Ruegeria arenilitoris TaxID=1173585 RepID=UPI00147D2F29|nr:TRAP transporter small permease [Ruegeria arenilitoris]